MKFLSGLFFGLLISCSTMKATDSILSFKDREFLVHPDLPAMSFPHDKTTCIPKRFWPDKCTTEHIEDNYDMNDKAVREKFIAADCTMTCAGRFQ